MKYVIESGGKQYIAKQGQVLPLAKIEAEVDSVVELKVLSAINEDNIDFSITSVTAKVEEQKKDKKIVAFKKIRRHRYEKKKGYRSCITLVRVL